MKKSSWLGAMIAGALFFVVGVLWTLVTLVQWPSKQAQWERKSTDLQTLADMEDRLKPLQSAQAAFHALDASSSSTFSGWMRDTFPHIRAEVRPRDRLELTEAWQLERVEVVVDDIDVEELGALMALAEMQRPPWRLVEAHLRASDRMERAVKANMIVERIFPAGTNP
jgi:hypothetical protein